MPIASVQPAPERFQDQLDARVREIRAFVADGYPERARKALLVLVDDFHASIPAELRAAASAKSGEYLKVRRAGYGDNREALAKLEYDMLTIAENIFETLKSEHDSAQRDSPTAPGAEPHSAKIIPLPGQVPPTEGLPPKAKPPVPKTTPERKNIDTPVVRVRNLSKQFSSTQFELASLSFELKVRQITALVGRNGSGKSTLLKIIQGELSSDTGSLEYPLIDQSPRRYKAMRANIGYVPQRPPRWRGRLRENLEFIAAAYGIRGQANVERVTWVLNRFNLVNFEDYRWAELSAGYQLRYELARALLHRPYLLIFDEPLANLDVVSQQEFLYDLKLMTESEASPAAILLTSQHLFEMETIADQLIVLNEGKAVFLGDTRALGNDRECNSFEIASAAPESALHEALQHGEDVSIRRYATHYQVDLPLEVDRAHMLNTLKNLAGTSTYFRDISKSARPRMSDEKWRE